MREIKKYLNKLEEKRAEMKIIHGNLMIHGYSKEAEYIRTKLEVLDNIISNLTLIIDDRKQIDNIKFDF